MNIFSSLPFFAFICSFFSPVLNLVTDLVSLIFLTRTSRPIYAGNRGNIEIAISVYLIMLQRGHRFSHKEQKSVTRFYLFRVLEVAIQACQWVHGHRGVGLPVHRRSKQEFQWEQKNKKWWNKLGGRVPMWAAWGFDLYATQDNHFQSAGVFSCTTLSM